MALIVEKTTTIDDLSIDKVRLNNILRKNYIIIDAAGTGKTVFIKHLLAIIAENITSTIVFCPEGRSEYSQITPEEPIYHHFDINILKECYETARNNTRISADSNIVVIIDDRKCMLEILREGPQYGMTIFITSHDDPDRYILENTQIHAFTTSRVIDKTIYRPELYPPPVKKWGL